MKKKNLMNKIYSSSSKEIKENKELKDVEGLKLLILAIQVNLKRPLMIRVTIGELLQLEVLILEIMLERSLSRHRLLEQEID